MPAFTKSDAIHLLSEDKTSCTIPDTFTSIAESAFDNEDNEDNTFDLLQTVVIPDTITSVGDYAFQSCRALVTINLPNTITSLGHQLFFACSSLISIDLPNSITSILDSTFYNCSSITSITVPPSVSQCEGFAFYNCHALKSIIIPDAALNNNNYGILYNGEYWDPFTGCTELIAIAQSLNMSVKECLLHQNERIRMVNLRVAVLFSLKTINNARILAGSEGRAFNWGNPIGIERGNLNGVLAEDRIPPFDMWREIVMFL